jgi:hydroxyacylglutathione hydrolase
MLGDSEPVGVAISHARPDHVGALAEIRAKPGVPVLAHRVTEGIKADRWLEEGDMVEVGDHRLWVRHAPVNSDDRVCYGIEGDHRMIFGDAIFEGGPGHTSSSEDFETTLGTLRAVILSWSDDTICYPGHGPSFRLDDKRPAIEAFLAKDHGSFFGDAIWEM